MALQVLGVWVLFGLMSLPLAQDRAPVEPPREPPEAPEIMLTGCVAESPEPGTYLLKHAIAKPENKDLPRLYRLVSAKRDVDFVVHVNHQVHASGRAEVVTGADPVPGERLQPRELPAFTVQTIQSVSERCLEAPR
jgi:hypothetical protein